MEIGFACGSMVLFYPFSQNCGSESHNFVKKIQESSALPEAISPSRETAYVVSDNRTYAVVHQTGRFTRYTAESPAAAWYVVFFCTKKFTE
jgi:hypothetical protein